MPTIKFPKNPNVDTAFVEQDDGTKNRALMIAPQDISTLELPNNPNSTKGYITVDGQKQRVILTADITGGGGGSSLPDQTGHSGEFLTTDGTEASWAAVSALQNTSTGSGGLGILGTTSSIGAVVIGDGAQTTGGSQQVVIGKGAQTSGNRAVAIGLDIPSAGNDSVCVGAYSTAWASGVAIGRGAATAAANAGIISISGFGGTNSTANTFAIANTNGTYEIMSANGTIPTARLTNAINKYSSMPTASADYLGQIAQFTGTTDATYTHGYIYECVSDGGNPATYSWTAVSVQAGGSSLPSQTGNSGKFLTTDGTNASWGTVSSVPYTIYGTNSLTLGFQQSGYMFKTTVAGLTNNISSGISSVAVFGSNNAPTGGTFIFGNDNRLESTDCVIVGKDNYINHGINQTCVIGTGNGSRKISEKGFYWATTSADYKILDANGNLPADRIASTTGLADGNYKLRLTMSSGVPTLSWVAE